MNVFICEFVSVNSLYNHYQTYLPLVFYANSGLCFQGLLVVTVIQNSFNKNVIYILCFILLSPYSSEKANSLSAGHPY